MSSDLLSLQPLAGAFAFVAFFALFGEHKNGIHRMLYGLAVIATGTAYLSWRLTETLTNADGGLEPWPLAMFVIEMLGHISGFIFVGMMMRSPQRAAPVDLSTKITGTPHVDILIPTYNEPEDVVDKAIIAALNQDYPATTVYVLDDGRRPWLRSLCENLGAVYLTRDDNKHAKAGNLNAALQHCRGEFIVIMDADFAAGRNFVSECLPFFADEKVAIVQTPQAFYNQDVIQLNLGVTKNWVDEQRLFFSEIMPARAQWDAAFSCGSCSMTRRAAIDKIGGFPTDSITEDMLTTLRLKRAGYRTVYLNESLSLGLSADTADSYFTQRERWARGNIQIMFLWKELLGNPALNLTQKVFFLPSFWLVMPITTIAIILMPIVYFVFGLPPTTGGTLQETLAFALPFVLMQQGYMVWISNRTYAPLVSSAIHVFTAFRLLPSVVATLIKPFGAPFRVTPKATMSEQKPDWFTAGMIAAAWLLTIAGVLLNTFPGLEQIPSPYFFPVAMFWSTFSLATLTVAFWIAIPRRYERKTHRFTVQQIMTVDVRAVRHRLMVVDMSMGGALLEAGVHTQPGEHLTVTLPDGTDLPAVVMRAGQGLGIAWEGLTPLQYRRLVEFLFCGQFMAAPQKASESNEILAAVFKTLWR